MAVISWGISFLSFVLASSRIFLRWIKWIVLLNRRWCCESSVNKTAWSGIKIYKTQTVMMKLWNERDVEKIIKMSVWLSWCSWSIIRRCCCSLAWESFTRNETCQERSEELINDAVVSGLFVAFESGQKGCLIHSKREKTKRDEGKPEKRGRKTETRRKE